MANKAQEVAPILSGLVKNKIDEIGIQNAAKFFNLGEARIKHWKSGVIVPPLWAAEKVYTELLSRPSKEQLPSTGEPPLAANWEGKKVQICIPWYKSASPFTAFGLLAMFEKGKMGIIMNCGDAFVAHTRNKIAASFMQSEAEWSLWVDDDMILPMGNAAWYNAITGFNLPEEFAGMHTINRLLSHDQPIVGGLYFGRASNGRPMYAEGANSPQEAEVARQGPQDRCKPTKWVATGCLLIHRKVFLGIEKKFPHLKGNYFSPSEHDLVDSVQSMQDLLADQTIDPKQRVVRAATMLESGRLLSNTNSKMGVGEDVIFCTRAAAAGFQPHVDMGLVIGHVGSQVFGPFNTSASGEGFVRV
jgi:hypothetical protein